MADISAGGEATQQHNDALAGNIATRASSISSIHESPHSPLQHATEIVAEHHSANSADEDAEQPQLLKENGGLLEQNDAKTTARPAFSLYDRFG